MTSNIKDSLEELHDAVAINLLNSLKETDKDNLADASTVRNAIAFLKNNGIELSTRKTLDLEEELNKKTIPFDSAMGD